MFIRSCRVFRSLAHEGAYEDAHYKGPNTNDERALPQCDRRATLGVGGPRQRVRDMRAWHARPRQKFQHDVCPVPSRSLWRLLRRDRVPWRLRARHLVLLRGRQRRLRLLALQQRHGRCGAHSRQNHRDERPPRAPGDERPGRAGWDAELWSRGWGLEFRRPALAPSPTRTAWQPSSGVRAGHTSCTRRASAAMCEPTRRVQVVACWGVAPLSLLPPSPSLCPLSASCECSLFGCVGRRPA